MVVRGVSGTPQANEIEIVDSLDFKPPFCHVSVLMSIFVYSLSLSLCLSYVFSVSCQIFLSSTQCSKWQLANVFDVQLKGKNLACAMESSSFVVSLC